MIEFAYNNSHHALIKTSSFYLMYDYHLEIHYEVEDNFIEKKISSTQERVK